MKNIRNIIILTAMFAIAATSCKKDKDIEINIAAISGVTAPVAGATPVTAITATEQYTGAVAWQPADDAFAYQTVYIATITLRPKKGYTLAGVETNFFTVAGATTVTHAAGSGVVTTVFPKTADPPPPVAPTITSQPQDLLVNDGEDAEFTVEAEGSAPLSYQWEYNPGSGWEKVQDVSNDPAAIASATTKTLTLEAAFGYDGDLFRCVVSNSEGSVTSGEATLSVRSVWIGDAVPGFVIATGGSTTYTLTAKHIADGKTVTSTQWRLVETALPGVPDGITVSSTPVSDGKATVTIAASLVTAAEIYYFIVEIDGVTSSNEGYLQITAPDGSELHPFIVNSVATLKKVGTRADGWGLDKHYLQTENITLSATETWTPIGTDANEFTGSYNGGGYSISNLSIPSATDRSLGLFGVIGERGAVRNVALRSVKIISTGMGIGGIAGGNDRGTIENCYVTGEVRGSYDVGGIAGLNFQGVIKNCYTTCNVTGSLSGVGGIAGIGEGSSTVAVCYATGTITGAYVVGGIAGNINSGNANLCVALNNEVAATDATDEVGRVVGYHYDDSGTMSNNFARAAGMVLKLNGATISPTEATLTGRDGADIAAADTHGSDSVTFWSTTCDTDLWDIGANRLPWLKTTEGGEFSEAQNPTVQ